MRLRELFELTGREFDLAEAHWELMHATDYVVEMSPEAKMALALSFYGLYGDYGWIDGPGAPIRAITPTGGALVVERGRGDALRAWLYLSDVQPKLINRG